MKPENISFSVFRQPAFIAGFDRQLAAGCPNIAAPAESERDRRAERKDGFRKGLDVGI